MSEHGANTDFRTGERARFLAQIAENVREIIWMADARTGEVCYINPAYERIVGRSVESLYDDPNSWRDAIHPDDRGRDEVLQYPLDTTGNIEFRIVRPDGEVRWIWTHGAPLWDGHDQLLGVVGVAEDITERKRAELALETSLSLLRATLDSTADGILVVDEEGKIGGFNRRFLELWRIPDFVASRGHDDMLLNYVTDQLADPSGFLVKVRQLYADPRAESFDVLTFRDGRVFERYSRPQRLDGRTVGRVWSFRDVSARVRAEEALRIRNRRLDMQNQVLLKLARYRVRQASDVGIVLPEITKAAAEMLTADRVGVWVFDEEHTKIRLIELYERGKNLHSAGAELKRADYPAYFEALELERSIDARDARSDPRTRDFTETYLAPLGITTMLDAPIRAGGQLRGVVCFECYGEPRKWTPEDRTFAGSVADLVSLTMESAELQRAESGVNILLEASRILAASIDYRTTLANVARLAVPVIGDWCLVSIVENGQLHRVAMAHADPEKEHLLNELEEKYPASETATPATRVVASGEAEMVPYLTEELLHERTVDEGHRKLIREAGVRSYMAVPLTVRGNTIGAITFVSASTSYDSQDLALAKELANRAAIAVDNAQLHQTVHEASRAKSNFLAVMSHELRTPLAAIAGYADLLEGGIPEPVTPKQKEQAGRIKLCAFDLSRMIDEILSFSRMETGEERFSFDTVDIGELCRDVARIARPMAEEHHLEFRLEVPDVPTTVRTDGTKLRHILMDLISNAVKFTKEGYIALEAVGWDGMAIFRVRDTGLGITPENQKRIFDPFFQVEDALTREKGGTGIGLAVASRLARHLGGEITVESTPKRGSTFTVAIPSHKGL